MMMLQTLLKPVWLCLLLLAVSAAGCAGSPAGSTSGQEGQPQRPTDQPTAVPVADSTAEAALRQQLEEIASAAQGQVGIAITLLETGETVALNGDQPFPMQSVYKFPIGMAVLAQVDRGALRLDQPVRVEPSDFISDWQHSPIRDENPQGLTLSLAELLRHGVSESDGTASDVLLALAGGPAAVDQYLRGLGVNHVRVLNTELELGQDTDLQYRNSATPNDMVLLLRRLHQGQGLSAASRAFLLQLMTETPTGPNRIKGLLPEGTVVAHKTGSSRTVAGLTAATNDVGLVTLPDGRQFAIAVFVSDSAADDATRERVIAQAARAAWDTWSP